MKHDRAQSSLGAFERYLTLWVVLCIVVGIGLGKIFPAVFEALGQTQIANVNIPVGILIWVMIVPMLVRIDFRTLREVRKHLKGIGITLFVNWCVKPFSMALLAWIFIRVIFASYLPEHEHDSYIAGLILLAAAPCTAMVFVWSKLVDGDPLFTLSQVALNDVIMVVAFAPIVGLLLGVSSIAIPWDTLLLSVAFFIVIPVLISRIWRSTLVKRADDSLKLTLKRAAPWSTGALLATLILLFAFQGTMFLAQPLTIGILAIPILIQVVLVSGLAYLLNRMSGEAHAIAGPSCLIVASNFFELAVAAAISMFGTTSGATLATVVGVLVEVPIMLAVVHVVNRTQRWYIKA